MKFKRGHCIKYIGTNSELDQGGYIAGDLFDVDEIKSGTDIYTVARPRGRSAGGVSYSLSKNGKDFPKSAFFIFKTVFSVGDIIGVKPECDASGQHANSRGTILAADATHYKVVWDYNGLEVDYTHNEVEVAAYLVTNHVANIPLGGPHKCADWLEFCQGFRFDYHFCKVCGTKQNAA
jgi:hypothetical protein